MSSSQPRAHARSRRRATYKRKSPEYVSEYATCKVEETEDLVPPIIRSNQLCYECISPKRPGSLPIDGHYIAHHSTGFPNQLDLFTPVSNFPSRTLPPPGVRAQNLDGPDDKSFKAGDRVMVRRFDESVNDWTDWRQGIVAERGDLRGYIGTFAREYIVRTTCAVTGKEILSRHLPYLFEIWPMRLQLPNPVDPEKWIKRKQKLSNVYARIKVPGTMNGIPFNRIWALGRVMKWEHGDPNRITVRFLDGPFVGQVHHVDEVLPYTPETSIACRQRGFFAARFDGRLEPPLTS